VKKVWGGVDNATLSLDEFGILLAVGKGQAGEAVIEATALMEATTDAELLAQLCARMFKVYDENNNRMLSKKRG